MPLALYFCAKSYMSTLSTLIRTYTSVSQKGNERKTDKSSCKKVINIESSQNHTSLYIGTLLRIIGTLFTLYRNAF